MLRSRESEILERSELESEILPPTPQPWSKGPEIQSRRHSGVFVSLAPQTKLQPPKLKY